MKEIGISKETTRFINEMAISIFFSFINIIYDTLLYILFPKPLGPKMPKCNTQEISQHKWERMNNLDTYFKKTFWS